MRAERAAERRVDRDLLADICGAGFVEAEAAVGLGNLEAQEIEVRRFLQERARHRPVVGVQARLVREDFLPHELGGRPPKQALFVAQIVAGEEVHGVERPQQERPAAVRLASLRHKPPCEARRDPQRAFWARARSRRITLTSQMLVPASLSQRRSGETSISEASANTFRAALNFPTGSNAGSSKA